MKKDVIKNPVIVNLMESVNAYHQEKNIRVFEFENIKDGVRERTQEYRRNKDKSKKYGITIPENIAKPWIKLLEKIAVLHLPLAESNPNMKEKEFLSLLGNEFVFLCAIMIKGKVKGFVCMDDSISGDEKYEIPITIAKFLSYHIKNDQYENKEQYFVDYLENLDFPTGVFNRNGFMQMLMSKENVTLYDIGIIHLDYNEIRKINEKHGFEYGDKMLEKTAKLLINFFAYFESQIFRISGDEFLVMCFHVDEVKFNEINKDLKVQLHQDKQISIAIGSAWRHKTSFFFDLIMEAEQNMQINKSKYYMNMTKTSVKSKLTRILKNEIKEGLYPIYLQPKIDINTEELVGAEALVRKVGRDGTIYLPDTFIANYETDGVIQYIDLHVLEETVKLIKDEEDKGVHVFTISVNFSRVTLLERDIVKKMAAICKKYNVETNKVCIEITESMNSMTMNELINLTQKIKGAGFLLSLDDYGSEYSNVMILANINFDEVKLDRSIIQIIHNNVKARSIVSSAITLCKGFRDTRIVAEGIETKETLDILRAFNCDYGQGFYFSKPISIEEFKKKYILKRVSQKIKHN